jgi:PPP family 3-phenylpropionic acid transporter
VAAGRRILLAYLAYFTALGASFPYLPVFYHDLGLALPEIGLLTAIQAGTQLALAPVWGGAADRFPHTRLTLPLACAVAVAGGIALFTATSFAAVLVGSMVLYAGLSGIGPTLDARTLETLGRARHSRYGQVRAFGSLAFVISALIVGLVLDSRTSRDLFLIYLPALVVTMIVTATIPRRGSVRSVNVLRGARDIVADRGVALFFTGFIVVWAALAAANAFYSIQIVALGGNTGLVGIAWAVGASIEVPVMYGLPRLGARFGTERLLVLGAVAFALRSLLGAAVSDPTALVLIAPLEGLGFAFVYVGGVTVLAARAPAGLGGTAQGLFAASAGLATIIGSIAGGTVAGALGIPGLFAVCGAVGLVGAGILAVSLLGSRAMNRTGPASAT